MAGDATAALTTLHGISIGSLITGAGVWTAVATLVGIVLRSRVPMRKMKIEADEQLRVDLMQQLAQDRTEHAERSLRLEEKVEQQRVAYEARLEKQAAEFSAELGKMRHKANNATMCLDALLMLLKAAPDKVVEHVAAITSMREAQRIAEGAESGQVSAAKITAAAAKGSP